MRPSVRLQLVFLALACAASWLQPVSAQEPALDKDLLMKGKVTVWGNLSDARTVRVGLYALTFDLRFADKDLADAASKLQNKSVRIVGNLKVAAKSPESLLLEVSDIKPGQAEKEAPGEAPGSAYFEVAGEVVLRARLTKGDPKLKCDAVMATAIRTVGNIPVFFKGYDVLDGFTARHQAIPEETKKNLPEKLTAPQDYDVLVRARLQGHNFQTRAEFIAYIIQDVQAVE